MLKKFFTCFLTIIFSSSNYTYSSSQNLKTSPSQSENVSTADTDGSIDDLLDPNPSISRPATKVTLQQQSSTTTTTTTPTTTTPTTTTTTATSLPFLIFNFATSGSNDCPLNRQSNYKFLKGRKIYTLKEIQDVRRPKQKCISNYGLQKNNYIDDYYTTYCFKLEVDRPNEFSSDWHIHGLWPQWDQFCAFNTAFPIKDYFGQTTQMIFNTNHDNRIYGLSKELQYLLHQTIEKTVDGNFSRDLFVPEYFNSNSYIKLINYYQFCDIDSYFSNYNGDKQNFVNELKEKMTYERGFTLDDYVQSMIFWEKEYIKHGTCVQEFLDDKFLYFKKALELFDDLNSNNEFDSCTSKSCGFCFDADFNRMVCA